MKIGTLAAVLFLVMVTIGAVIILVRSGTLASKIMFAGTAIFWTGVVLAVFGPKDRKFHGPSPTESTSDLFIQSVLVTETPSLPVGYIMVAGFLLFAGGFLWHARGV